jgi:hypothetical protein
MNIQILNNYGIKFYRIDELIFAESSVIGKLAIFLLHQPLSDINDLISEIDNALNGLSYESDGWESLS